MYTPGWREVLWEFTVPCPSTKCRDPNQVSHLGPVSQKAQNLFAPKKPFLVNQYLRQRGVYTWNFLYEENLFSYEEYMNKTAL